MSESLNFRHKTLASLTNEIGCYALADLDNVPIYVGQSVDGIRARVRRHLTSARSDIVANRQIDVWEIGFVWAYPTIDDAEIPLLESILFHQFDRKSQLMNGSIPQQFERETSIPEPTQVVQIISDDELKERLSPELRLPRQAEHYARLVDHFLVVKNSSQIARSMNAHFQRLAKYHNQLVG